MEEGHNPYDNPNSGSESLERTSEEHAYDNATFEAHGEPETAVDIHPSVNGPDGDVHGENDVTVPQEGEAHEMGDRPEEYVEAVAVTKAPEVADDDAVIEVAPEPDYDETNDGIPVKEDHVDIGAGEPRYVGLPYQADAEADALPKKFRDVNGSSRKYESIRGLTTSKMTDEERRKREKSMVTCIILLLIVVIGVVVGLVIFFILFSLRSTESSTVAPEVQGSTTSATSGPIVIDGLSVDGTLTFADLNFTDALNDPNSTEYKAIVNEITGLLDNKFQSGNLSEGYEGVTITGISQGSLIIEFTVEFTSVPSSLAGSDATTSGDIENIKSALTRAITNEVNEGIPESLGSVSVEVNEVTIEFTIVTAAPEETTSEQVTEDARTSPDETGAPPIDKTTVTMVTAPQSTQPTGPPLDPCAESEFYCQDNYNCIASDFVCDFVPHCAVTRWDESEETCQHSQFGVNRDVAMGSYTFISTPTTFPSRDLPSHSDFALFRLTGQPNSHLLFEVIEVKFNGNFSYVSIAQGHDPIESVVNFSWLALFFPGITVDEPRRVMSPLNMAYVLISQRKGETVTLRLRVVAYACDTVEHIPCTGSPHCYLIGQICDGTADCILSEEDEKYCGDCASDEFACANGLCVPLNRVCDDEWNCGDGSDERNCTCPQEAYACEYSNLCVPLEQVCDEIDHCPISGDDELNCCAVDQYSCENKGGCVSQAYVCDGEFDCLYGDDELYCCLENEYSCKYTGQCFPEGYVCDGVTDCPHWDDELNCTCGVDQFKCSPPYSTCIGVDYVCDFVYSCYGSDADETDELCGHSTFGEYIVVATDSPVTISTPSVYPPRNVSNSRNFALYRLVGEDVRSKLFVELLNVSFSEFPSIYSRSYIAVGQGLQPVSEPYLLALLEPLEGDYPIGTGFSTKNNTAYILIAQPLGETVTFTIRVTAFKCDSDQYNCLSSPHCYHDDQICDGYSDCVISGEDESYCPQPCDTGIQCFEDGKCLDYFDICDWEYDCPLGFDEYNCTGCFACPGYDDCLGDVAVCDFTLNCPGGEDEAEDLCNHSQFITEINLDLWENVEIHEPDVFPVRGTPSNNFADYAHFVFTSPPGTYLFLELEEFSSTYNGFLASFAGVSAGAGKDPWDIDNVRGVYYPGLNVSYSISDTFSFSLESDIGFGFIVQPKGEYVDVKFRVTAIACAQDEYPCLGSPHCLNPLTDYCDGVIQCPWSREDEAECDRACPNGVQCYADSSCVEYADICDWEYDCPLGVDEYNCTGCFACPGNSECLVDAVVCDFTLSCPGGEDEGEELCGHSQFITEINLDRGESVEIHEPTNFPVRGTPASAFADFAHYVFLGPPETYLFVELIKFRWTENGKLWPYARITAGVGRYPWSIDSIRGIIYPGFNISSSVNNEYSFSLQSNVGYGFIAQPKGENVNVTVRITAVACESPALPCAGSPHCWNPLTDYCDGEAQCLWSREDETNCPEGTPSPLDCFPCSSEECINLDWVCDGVQDCVDGSDEAECDPCPDEFQCPTGPCVQNSSVCNILPNCPLEADEAGCEWGDVGVNFTLSAGNQVNLDLTSYPVGTNIFFFSVRFFYFTAPSGYSVRFVVTNANLGHYGAASIYKGHQARPDVSPAVTVDYLTGDTVVPPEGLVVDTETSTALILVYESAGEAVEMEITVGVGPLIPDCRAGQYQCENGLCLNSTYVCDGRTHCDYNEDEMNCGCESGLECFENQRCLEFDDICDLEYDCPIGYDEYNCTGCFACPGSSVCLLDIYVCDFSAGCPGGEDEAEDLCGHSQFLSENNPSIGESIEISEPNFPVRSTPANSFFDFAHYVFVGPPGTNLFVELEGFSSTSNSYLSSWAGASAGVGKDPWIAENVRAAYFPGLGISSSISDEFSFSLLSNVGFGLIVQPKGEDVNITVRVTVIACTTEEFPCIGSPSCWNLVSDYCDGVVQCPGTEEDENGCPPE